MPATQATDLGRPIGVFDSGVGGLTVVSALMRQLPGESFLYLGDTARLPYGTKSADTVARYSRRNIDFLIQRGVKAVVVACNTASAVGLSDLDLPVPVWGVIGPGARAAVASGAQTIGVLATESTVLSDAYGQAIRALAPEIEVMSQPCPLFVPLVEEGWKDDPVAEIVAGRYLAPLLAAGVRTMVLGCTHYPLLTQVLRRAANEADAQDVKFVDSAQVIALEVERRLHQLGLAIGAGSSGLIRHHLCVTDLSDRFERIAHDLLQHFHTFDDALLESSISLELVEV